MEENVMLYNPVVFAVGEDYQIVFLTSTAGLGRIEIDGEVFADEEGGLIRYGTVHKIPVDGKVLNSAGHYTVVFTEYKDKKPYFPEGEEKIRREYRFRPAVGENLRIFHFADTHGRTETPLELYENTGDCDIVVLNGDISDNCYAVENFSTSFEIASRTAKGEIPVINSRGNHDTRGYAAQFLPDYFPTACRNGRRESFYSFRQGSLWGLVLDCGEDKRDTNESYGGTVSFETFRKRETEYLDYLIRNSETEYNAPGVKHRIAICHIPFVEYFKYPFDVAGDVYDTWTKKLGEIGIELLICGHMHSAYFIPAHKEGFRDASFPTAVLSDPAVKREDGTEYYVGGLIEIKDGRRSAKIIPYGESIEF